MSERIGVPLKDFTIYDSDDQQRVIKQIYKELMIDDKFLPVKSAISQISGYKDKLLSAKDVAAEVAARYQGCSDFQNLYRLFQPAAHGWCHGL